LKEMLNCFGNLLPPTRNLELIEQLAHFASGSGNRMLSTRSPLPAAPTAEGFELERWLIVDAEVVFAAVTAGLRSSHKFGIIINQDSFAELRGDPTGRHSLELSRQVSKRLSVAVVGVDIVAEEHFDQEKP
jgi:hypothetical protein